MDIKEKALDLLLANIKEGYSNHFKRRYFYCAPDEMHYHQWFWDSCFHMIVMSEFRPDLAVKEFRSLMSCQTEDGFIPHIIFWKWRPLDVFQYLQSWRKEVHPVYKYFTAEIQPPVIGISLRRIYEKTKSKKFLEKYLPRVQKYFDYLGDKRDLDKNLLISVITPMESNKIAHMLTAYRRVGWDIDRIFELDIFNFEDVAVNTIYALSLEHLAYLWRLIDKKEAQRVQQLYEQVKEKIIEKYWDEDDRIFYGRFHKHKKEYRVKIKTVSSLFPLCLDIEKKYVNALVKHMVDPNEFWLPYPVPSVARNEKSFGPLTDTRFIWRGTTWINTNWFLCKGLLRHGKKKLYEKIRARTYKLVEKHGFCEYYDPITAEPGDAMRNFGWSTLAADI
jgi:glycogen debranching enzyme